MFAITTRSKNVIGGVLMIALGLSAVLGARDYGLGTVTDMGPGYFPTAIGCILALTGVAIAGSGLMSSEAQVVQAERFDWRGWVCIILGIVAFVLLGRNLGMIPATFAIVCISALGDRQNSLRACVLLAAFICVVAWLVFWWGLQIHLPLFAWGWQ